MWNQEGEEKRGAAFAVSPTLASAGGAGGGGQDPQNHAARLQLSRGFTSVKLVPDYELVLLADGAFGASLRHSEGR